MKNRKTILGLSLAACFTLATDTMAGNQLHLAGNQIKANSVLPLNFSGKSFVLAQLENQFHIASPMLANTKDPELVARTVAKHSAVFIDASYLQYQDPVLDAYLSEAYKQGKSIIIENANNIAEDQLQALPSMTQGDLVLIHPSLSGQPDKVFSYSAALPVSESIAGEAHYQRLGAGEEMKESWSTMEIKPIDLDVESVYAQNAINLNAMDELKRGNMLQQFTQDLVSPNLSVLALSDINNNEDVKANVKPEVITTNSVGGFTFAYPCPQNLKDARECYASVSINHLYNYNDGEKIFNGTRHYAYAMYKADGIKYAAYSMHGSANPTMTADNDTEKAWYLEWVDLDVDVKNPDSTYANAVVISRLPGNEADTVALTSTSGLSVTAGADSEGKLTAGVSFDQSNSVRKDITDWESSTNSIDGRDAGWLYELKHPGSDSDWVSTPAFKKPRYKSVPTISKSGLQYVSEGIWTIPVTDTGRFHVDTTTKWQVKKRKITDRSIFHYKQSWWSTWWSKSRYTWLNMGWLQ